MRILEKQQYHLLFLVVFAGLFLLILPSGNFLAGNLFGISTLSWFILSIAISVTHQVYVLICWRIQLKLNWITRNFGEKGFKLYVRGFLILFFSRILSVVFLGISNQNSMGLNRTFLLIVAAITSVPMFYLFYSVLRYFGIHRAAGADHFDPAYHDMPRETRGMYRYVKNGMYIFGFLIMWQPGLIFASESALLVALFNHIYIWVHYFTLEVPDMQKIYGEQETDN
ncbi:methyltransferase [Candidatus Lokiarchaeum ossiferum]|uniref:methyltransferase n=1 Tax=Candidatus Lokiarchaeum ossiferum TaxID=2951803 RepID=UPI00352E73E0